MMYQVQFTMYTLPLCDVIRHCYMWHYQLFTDDMQLHRSASPRQFAKLLLDPVLCRTMREWMACNTNRSG